MESSIGLVAMDIDGTLTDSAHRVPARVRDAVRACLDRGVVMVLATGRVVRTTVPIVEAIDPRLSAITNNGAVIHERFDQPPLVQRLLARGVALEVIARLRAAGLTPLVFDDPDRSERIAVPRGTDLSPAFASRFDGLLDFVDDLGDWLGERALLVTTLAGATTAAEATIRAQTLLQREHFGDRASVSPLWHPLYGSWILDFIAPGVSKWQAIGWYAARRGVAPGAVMALGDGLNDVEMVREAGLGVAMANCGPELRAVADALVADSDHDGVAEALERWVLGAEVR